jgi:hypothetical protein
MALLGEELAQQADKLGIGVASLFKPMLEAVEYHESQARHWYRLLVGDKRPLPRVHPNEGQMRLLYQRLYRDDPQKAEYELQKALGEFAERMDQYCWGANWSYLHDALAAYCGITREQALHMTWDETAAALRAAYERQQAAQTATTANALAALSPGLHALWQFLEKHPGGVAIGKVCEGMHHSSVEHTRTQLHRLRQKVNDLLRTADKRLEISTRAGRVAWRWLARK